MSSITARSNHGPWQTLITTFHGLVTRSWPAQPKGKHRLLCSCIKLMGVTSLGRHLRPACNQGLLKILLNPKNMIFDLNTVCFYWLPIALLCYFRWRHHSSLPMRGIWEHFEGSCLRSRIYPTPCFFEYIATHPRGLGRSLRFTHAQTNSVTSTAKSLGFKQVNRLLPSDWSKWVTWTKWWRTPC